MIFELRNSGNWIDISQYQPNFEEEVEVYVEGKTYKAIYFGTTEYKVWELSFLDEIGDKRIDLWKPIKKESAKHG